MCLKSYRRDMKIPVLRMPVELIREIAKRLPSTDRVCFALSSKYVLSASYETKLEPLSTFAPFRSNYQNFLGRVRPLNDEGQPDATSWRICGDCLKLRPRGPEHWVEDLRKFPKPSKWRCMHANLRRTPWLPLWHSRSSFILGWAWGVLTTCPQCAVALCAKFDNRMCGRCAREENLIVGMMNLLDLYNINIWMDM